MSGEDLYVRIQMDNVVGPAENATLGDMATIKGLKPSSYYWGDSHTTYVDDAGMTTITYVFDSLSHGDPLVPVQIDIVTPRASSTLSDYLNVVSIEYMHVPWQTPVDLSFKSGTSLPGNGDRYWRAPAIDMTAGTELAVSIGLTAIQPLPADITTNDVGRVVGLKSTAMWWGDVDTTTYIDDTGITSIIYTFSDDAQKGGFNPVDIDFVIPETDSAIPLTNYFDVAYITYFSFAPAVPSPPPSPSSPPNEPLVITVKACGVTELRLTGPWWSWDAMGGPLFTAAGDDLFTFSFNDPFTADMEYLLVADGVQESLVDNAQSGECDALIGAGSMVTDYNQYANRKWQLTDSKAVSLNYDSCVVPAAASCPSPSPPPVSTPSPEPSPPPGSPPTPSSPSSPSPSPPPASTPTPTPSPSPPPASTPTPTPSPSPPPASTSTTGQFNILNNVFNCDVAVHMQVV